MRHRRLSTPTFAVVALLAASACGGDDDTAGSAPSAASTSTGALASTAAPASVAAPGTTAVIDPRDGGNYQPDVDAANFVAVVDNPYFPMLAGSRWVYEGESEGEAERNEIVVTNKNKTVMGIEATVVRDAVYVEDELVEDTFDWFAQDRDGNVWYLGEDSKEIEDGKVVSTEGSWEAGVDGALPGIVMPGDPAVGDAFRQEYYVGEAEDMFEIIDVGGAAEVPAGSFDDVITTKDWTPLEAEVIEEKQYAPGVGKIREHKVAGGEDVLELVRFVQAG